MKFNLTSHPIMKRIIYIIVLLTIVSTMPVSGAGKPSFFERHDEFVDSLELRYGKRESIEQQQLGFFATIARMLSDIQHQNNDIRYNNKSRAAVKYTPKYVNSHSGKFGNVSKNQYHSTAPAPVAIDNINAKPQQHYSTNTTPVYHIFSDINSVGISSGDGSLHTQSQSVAKSIGGGNGVRNLAVTHQSFHTTSAIAVNTGHLSSPIAPVGAVAPIILASKTSGIEDMEHIVPHKINGNNPPEIPFPDPIGDVPWVLMLIALGAYAIARRTIRKTNS